MVLIRARVCIGGGVGVDRDLAPRVVFSVQRHFARRPSLNFGLEYPCTSHISIRLSKRGKQGEERHKIKYTSSNIYYILAIISYLNVHVCNNETQIL